MTDVWRSVRRIVSGDWPISRSATLPSLTMSPAGVYIGKPDSCSTLCFSSSRKAMRTSTSPYSPRNSRRFWPRIATAMVSATSLVVRPTAAARSRSMITRTSLSPPSASLRTSLRPSTVDSALAMSTPSSLRTEVESPDTCRLKPSPPPCCSNWKLGLPIAILGRSSSMRLMISFVDSVASSSSVSSSVDSARSRS